MAQVRMCHVIIGSFREKNLEPLRIDTTKSGDSFDGFGSIVLLRLHLGSCTSGPVFPSTMTVNSRSRPPMSDERMILLRVVCHEEVQIARICQETLTHKTNETGGSCSPLIHGPRKDPAMQQRATTNMTKATSRIGPSHKRNACSSVRLA